MSGKKSSKQAIARRYAKALFEIAEEKKAIEKVEKDFADISVILNDFEDLQKVLKNSSLSKDTVHSIFAAILKKLSADKVTTEFCRLLGGNRRLVLLPEIIISFKAFVGESRGEISAEVTTAAPLTDVQKKDIAKQLKDATGKKVDFEEKIDEEIIGGLIIKIGSQMLDDSISGKLERLRVFQKEAALPS
jgi:F-type H+-transporting ATPase subunit delta